MLLPWEHEGPIRAWDLSPGCPSWALRFRSAGLFCSLTQLFHPPACQFFFPSADGRIEFSSVWVSIPTCPWQGFRWQLGGAGDAPFTPSFR